MAGECTYANEEDEWVVVPTEKESPTEATPEEPRLRVLTWNIWFEPLEYVARMAAIARTIARESPDILALQEVTSELESELLSMAPLKAYAEVPAPRSPTTKYYTLLLAHERLQCCSAQREPFAGSRHARDRLAARFSWRGISIHVTNLHLESPDPRAWGPDNLGTTERTWQLSKVLEDLCRDEDSLVVGDFNWIPLDGKFPTLPPGAVDVWPSLRPKEPGLTYDPENNGCARSKHSGRSDRALFGARFLQASAIRLVGTESLPACKQSSGRPVMPSDHFGILVELGLAPTPADLANWTSTVEQPIVFAEEDTLAESTEDSWICGTCGFCNRSRNSVCGGKNGSLGCKAPNPCFQAHGRDQMQGGYGGDRSTWTCLCGFKNRAANVKCGGVNGALGCKAPKPPDSPSSSSPWTCACGFKNRAQNSVCGGVRGTMGCKAPRQTK